MHNHRELLREGLRQKQLSNLKNEAIANGSTEAQAQELVDLYEKSSAFITTLEEEVSKIIDTSTNSQVADLADYIHTVFGEIKSAQKKHGFWHGVAEHLAAALISSVLSFVIFFGLTFYIKHKDEVGPAKVVDAITEKIANEDKSEVGAHSK